MIMAELHGKLSEEASSIDTSEDVLTSNVFQCLRYLKPIDGIYYAGCIAASFTSTRTKTTKDPQRVYHVVK